METKATGLTPQLILGATIVLLGLLFLLDNLNLIDAGRLWHYWPVVFIAIGLSKTLQPRDTPGRVLGFILVVGGTLLLLDNLGWIDFDMGDFWPAVLIFVGGMMLWKALRRDQDAELPRDGSSTINALEELHV